ncbi:MAG: YdiU family protein, partial [Deltaproteobacteria bacterium]|nr:YdiU family protein [Deltaproteobacteria bacterium]
MTREIDDLFVRTLPADPSRENGPRQVRGACFSLVEPTPVRAPRLLAASDEVAAMLGWTPEEIRSEEMTQVLAGNALLPGMRPYAACYGGHQFGNWAGQLGDGRAITLGEVVRPDTGRWELQLKGAGPTPYSRNADGRAVLRSSVREFLCSEAMFHLGVPTTRALSLAGTGEGVLRDMFYDGHPEIEPGAIVCRVSPTFLRLGSYEIHASRGDVPTLRALVDYTLRQFYPHLLETWGGPTPGAVAAMVGEIAAKTASMIVHWQRVGFVHGVMNTDNMTISGETIDYGPYGWLEGYDPDWTPNTTDAGGRRYRYGQQPAIGMWNLARFAEAMIPLVEDTALLESALQAYPDTFHAAHGAMWCSKLGLRPEPDDTALLTELHDVMKVVETDFTLFFRGLADVVDGPDEALLAPIAPSWYAEPDSAGHARIAAFVRTVLARAAREGDPAERRARM